MNNSMIDDFLYKAKIMDTGEWKTFYKESNTRSRREYN